MLAIWIVGWFPLIGDNPRFVRVVACSDRRMRGADNDAKAADDKSLAPNLRVVVSPTTSEEKPVQLTIGLARSSNWPAIRPINSFR